MVATVTNANRGVPSICQTKTKVTHQLVFMWLVAVSLYACMATGMKTQPESGNSPTAIDMLQTQSL